MAGCLVVTGDGLGNVVQSTRLMHGLIEAGRSVDVLLMGGPPPGTESLLGFVHWVSRDPRAVAARTREFGPYEWAFPNWMTKTQVGGIPHEQVVAGMHPEKSHCSESFAHVSAGVGAKVCPDPGKTRVSFKLPSVEDGKGGYLIPGFGKRILTLHMGSKKNPQHWLLKRYQEYNEVISNLLTRFEDLEVWVLGRSDTDEHLNPGLRAKVGNRIRTYMDLSPAEAAGFISQSHAFLGNDSGLSHVAAALAVPSFILYGPTWVVKNLPPAHATPITTDHTGISCRPCQIVTGKYGHYASGERCEQECLAMIPPEHVAAVVGSALEVVA